MQRQPVEVFCSFAENEKEDLLQQLESHLSTLQRAEMITTWHKRKVVAGSITHQEIDNHLNRANLILLLVSSDFLASDYCYGVEMQRALQKHTDGQAKVIPILLRPCLWQTAPFAHLEALPNNGKAITSWSNRDDAWTNVVEGIYNALQGTSQPSVQPLPHKSIGKEKAAMQPVKVLFLAANPFTTARLAIDEEMRSIEQKVRASEHRDALVFQPALAARPDDLLQQLNQHRPQIVHFSGHGDENGLYLAGNDGRTSRLVSTRALAALFTTLRDNIRLVFFNSCYSEEQAQTIVKSIDCVVGMKASIRDDAAAVFASSFYRAIGFGHSIQAAFDQGLVALLAEDIPEEDTPQLLVKDGIDASKIILLNP